MTRIGVDVGGTFTDIVVYDDDTNEVLIAKEPTTGRDPREGVLHAIDAVLPGGNLHKRDHFVHGTTVGLNALLTQTGARVGLLTTRGFRDVLEIRLGDRDDANDLFWRPPPPLVPRRLRLPVTERMLFNGTIRVPLEVDDVRRAVDVFVEEEVDSVAIVFLHSYANPDHELRAADALERFGFEGEISLSHEVSGEYREYERTTTTVVDAYIRPRMTAYLRGLERDLHARGFSGDVLVTRSGGGAMTLTEAERRPFETILSGPVAGVEGAATLSRQLGLRQVITADVGGTSFDTSLVVEGRPSVVYQGRVAGLPVQTPWVDVRSIGAGGGSLAYIDSGGLLRVGPASAGANPGPACYGRGGLQPTVTDAALILGMLGEAQLGNGLVLDREKAHGSFSEIVESLGVDVAHAAQGVITIATSSMADAIREITVEQGQDPRDAVLMAYGGAGPVFGGLLAHELGMTEIVVPALAGNFSAYGLLSAERTQSVARTQIIPLRDSAIDRAADVVAELLKRVRDRQTASKTILEVAADMRYVGQEYTLTVPLPMQGLELVASCDQLHQAFAVSYQDTFGHSISEEVEIVALRVTSRVPAEQGATAARRARQSSFSDAEVVIRAYSFSRRNWVDFRCINRVDVASERVVTGPVLIREATTTIYLDWGWTSTCHDSGALLITSSPNRVRGE